MNTAILLAAGKSKRANQNKLWADVHGRPLWTLAYERLASHPKVDRMVVVVPLGETNRYKEFIHEGAKIVEGGETRMQSFLAGLGSLEWSNEDVILDHNAANPLVTSEEISNVIEAAKEYGAAAVSLPAVDTIMTEEEGFYSGIVDRENIRLMQTPQAVRGDILKSIDLEEATDLSSAILGAVLVKVLDANPANRKITYTEDLVSLTISSYMGEDSHRFSDGGVLKLGGLEIQDLPALEANSDGDVILHAIGRALAQAKGENFSKIADKLCEAGEKNSAVYLAPLIEGLKIHNVSIQIECKRPRIDDLPLRESLARILKVDKKAIRISAMTGEELTPFGRGEGIRCICVLSCM